MDKANDRVYIEDILKAIQLIERFVLGKTFDNFAHDPMLNSAVTRQIEIIGEAAKKLSEELKTELNHIPWRRITGMRDFLIHDYDTIDLEIVWKAATEEIPGLKKILELKMAP